MGLPAFLLLKLCLYAVALGLGAWRFRALGHATRGPLAIGLLAVARVVLGVALGFGALALGDALPAWSEAITEAAIPAIGFPLWVGIGKLAYRTPRLAQLLAFAAAAEVISLGLDYMMLSQLSKSIH